MTSTLRYLVIALSFTFALAVLSILGPKTVHAVTATLVQAVNTNSHPVPTSTDGKNVIRLSCGAGTDSSGTGSCLMHLSTQTSPYIVPAGKRLVIDAASAFVNTPTGYPATVTSYDSEIYFAFPLTYQQTSGFRDIYTSTPAIRDYVEAGKSLQMDIGSGNTTQATSLFACATGHLVDCTNGGGC